MKKLLIIVFVLCAIGSIGGTLLAGLNIYTRSTTPLNEQKTEKQETPPFVPSAIDH